MKIAPPTELFKPLTVPQKLLMGPGPSNSSPRILHALSLPVLGQMHSELFEIMDEIKKGIRYLFQTENKLTLAISASGHAGMEAVLSSLLQPGETVLIAVNGIWGLRAIDIAERHRAVVYKLEKSSLNDSFSIIEIENALQKYKPKVFFIVQGESSTGVYQNLEGIGDTTRRYGCLLAVDAVASLGAVPMFMDDWKIDALYAGSQKIIGVPPGLTAISFSPRAQAVITNRKDKGPGYLWDMTLLGQQWHCFADDLPRLYHHSTCSNLLYAFREGLAVLAEEGLENVIKRHKECALRLYRGIETLGLECYVEEEHKRLPSVTTVKIPQNVVDWQAVVGYAMKNYNLEISGGLGPTAGKVFRIGIMGYNATYENVDFTLRVFREALRRPDDDGKRISKL